MANHDITIQDYDMFVSGKNPYSNVMQVLKALNMTPTEFKKLLDLKYKLRNLVVARDKRLASEAGQKFDSDKDYIKELEFDCFLCAWLHTKVHKERLIKGSELFVNIQDKKALKKLKAGKGKNMVDKILAVMPEILMLKDMGLTWEQIVSYMQVVHPKTFKGIDNVQYFRRIYSEFRNGKSRLGKFEQKIEADNTFVPPPRSREAKLFKDNAELWGFLFRAKDIDEAGQRLKDMFDRVRYSHEEFDVNTRQHPFYRLAIKYKSFKGDAFNSIVDRYVAMNKSKHQSFEPAPVEIVNKEPQLPEGVDLMDFL